MFHCVFFYIFEEKSKRRQLRGILTAQCTHCAVRHDRDNFIRVNEENIAPNMTNNFEKRPYGDAGFHTAGSVDPKHTPYDVLSVIVWEKRVQIFPNCF